MSLVDDISVWIKEQLAKSSAKGIVLGLSGGVDSACVAVLSQMAAGKNVLALVMPCHSNPDDEECAHLLADTFHLRTKRVDLEPLYDAFVEIVDSEERMVVANLKPRLRMVTLYSFANKLNYLVAGTGNKSELTVGYFTKYGDGGVDLLPLGGLLKTEVRQLAKELKIPERIITRHPSAGLWEGQTDEGELGITYEDLDKAITAIETGAKPAVSEEIIEKVRMLKALSEHKRASLPMFKKNRRILSECDFS